MKKLKIAQIAPLSERIPPKKYGGIERVVSTLTEELVKRGHKVTLFASGDSLTSAKLISVHPKSLRESKLAGLDEILLLNIGLAYKMQKEFDIIHDHNGHISLPVAQIAQTPVVMTLHGPFTHTSKRLFETLNRPNLISISKAQAQSAPSVKITANVYNGLNVESLPFSLEHNNYLIFVGRISPEKGTHYAIEVAQYLNLPLIIAAKLDTVDIPYFEEYIGPRLSDEIKWIGEVDENTRNKLISKAMCFLHPVVFKEPFGLTLIESMATGTPVIAFKRGSIPEVIVNGKTGFVVEDTEEMVEAVGKINQIDRKFCRQYVLENFNAEKMTDGYEKVYQNILGIK